MSGGGFKNGKTFADFVQKTNGTALAGVDAGPDSSERGRAVVACDGHGNGCVLWRRGGSVEAAIEWWGHRLDELGLDDAPRGLSMWEGKVGGTSDDCGLEGTFRPLNASETLLLVGGLDPTMPTLEEIRAELEEGQLEKVDGRSVRRRGHRSPCKRCGQLGHYAKTCTLGADGLPEPIQDPEPIPTPEPIPATEPGE